MIPYGTVSPTESSHFQWFDERESRSLTRRGVLFSQLTFLLEPTSRKEQKKLCPVTKESAVVYRGDVMIPFGTVTPTGESRITLLLARFLAQTKPWPVTLFSTWYPTVETKSLTNKMEVHQIVCISILLMPTSIQDVIFDGESTGFKPLRDHLPK